MGRLSSMSYPHSSTSTATAAASIASVIVAVSTSILALLVRRTVGEGTKAAASASSKSDHRLCCRTQLHATCCLMVRNLGRYLPLPSDFGLLPPIHRNRGKEDTTKQNLLSFRYVPPFLFHYASKILLSSYPSFLRFLPLYI